MKTLLIAFVLACGLAPRAFADTEAPLPPAKVQAEYVPNTITLTWDASPSPDVAFYRVYRTFNFEGFPELVATRDPDEREYTEVQDWRYNLTVTAVDTAGNESPAAGPSLVGVGDESYGLAFALPAPNPSRGNVALSWTMPASASVRLSVVDLAGRTVRTLLKETVAAGPKRVTWDGRDARGTTVRPGAYFVRLESPWGSRSRMLVRVP